jgi:hypothetical protein
MSHSRISTAQQRNSPTLWPLHPDERTPMELAVEAYEEENRALKTLVISLSEIVLRTVVGKQ